MYCFTCVQVMSKISKRHSINEKGSQNISWKWNQTGSNLPHTGLGHLSNAACAFHASRAEVLLSCMFDILRNDPDLVPLKLLLTTILSDWKQMRTRMPTAQSWGCDSPGQSNPEEKHSDGSDIRRRGRWRSSTSHSSPWEAGWFTRYDTGDLRQHLTTYVGEQCRTATWDGLNVHFVQPTHQCSSLEMQGHYLCCPGYPGSEA